MAQMGIEELGQIKILLKEGYSIPCIASSIGRHKTTIYRFLETNGINYKSKKLKYIGGKGGRFKRIGKEKVEKKFSEIYRIIGKKEISFNASVVQSQRQKRRSEASLRYCRIKIGSKEEEYIIHHLKRGYSPEQISGRRRQEFGSTLSKNAIYSYIYNNNIPLKYKLRRKGKKYRYDKGKVKFKKKDKINIENRPQIVKDKLRIGDWEMDTIIGLRNGISKKVILTLVDRKSGFLVARLLENKSAISVIREIKKIFRRITKDKQYTITTDNGSEFADHEFITQYTGMKVYFCHPNSPGEKGLIENTNGLLREYFPKKTDFDTISKKQLQYYVSLINHRPRKRLHYLTPYEVFYNLLKVAFDLGI